MRYVDEVEVSGQSVAEPHGGECKRKIIHKSCKELAVERFSPMEGSDLALIDDLVGSLGRIAVSPILDI